jgi:hypothetical protein
VRVESVGFAPGEEARAARPEPTPPPPPPQALIGPSNVLDLDDWRTRRRSPPHPSERREDRGDGRQ